MKEQQRLDFASRIVPLVAAAGCLLLSAPALADQAGIVGTGSGPSVSWSDLQPGDDWTARVIDSLFPTSASVQTATGTMLQTISTFIMLMAGVWVMYASVLQIHRTAETGKIISSHFNGWVPVRIIVAMIFLIPYAGSVSMGQVVVIRCAKTAIGMARYLEDKVIGAVGPSALPIAEPMPPATRYIVAGIMQSELCRALVNLASNNPDLVPEPALSVSDHYITIAYSLAKQSYGVSATCGSVGLVLPVKTVDGSDFAMDWSDLAKDQQSAVEGLIKGVRPKMETIATTLWQTRDIGALRAMDAVLVDQTKSYTDAMSQIGSDAVAKVRKAYVGGANDDPGMKALHALGWSGLGAYFLEIGTLNAEVLSVGSVSATHTAPTWLGLGVYMNRDLAGMADAIAAYGDQQLSTIATADASSAPDGAPRLFGGAAVSDTPEGTFDRILRAIGINESILTLILNHLAAPSAGPSGWADPFANLMSLGHVLIHTGLLIVGGAVLATSKTVGGAATISNLLTGDIPAALASAATLALSGAIKAMLVPIFAGAAFFIGPGIMLAYILPMAPYAYWIAGVAGWFVLVVEVVLAVPFWALAHLSPQGDGLHGKGVRGYESLFTVMFRPTLMIAGLMFSYTLFGALSWLLLKSFSVATAFVFAHGWLLDNLIGVVVLLCVFASMEVAFATMFFRLISTLPHHVVTYAGFGSVGRVDNDAFADRTTGQGQKDTIEQVRKTATEAAGALKAPEGGSERKTLGTDRGTDVDSTTSALMRIAGPE